jgi:prefoldin subunit 5
MDNTLHQLKARVASLESKIDMLESELMYLNDMLIRCGFPEGVKTLKETVQELLAEDSSPRNYERPELI